MTEQFVLHAEDRAEQGKGASRRLRKQGRFPAIVYGAGKEPQAISLEVNELDRHLKLEAFYSQVLKLELGSSSEQVILRDIQRHPSRPIVLHIDLQRIVAGEEMRVVVPLHFVNEEECVGVKSQGGMLSHAHAEIELQCLPKNIPEFIEIDVETLGVGETIHFSDLKLPEGLVIPALAMGPEHDDVVVTVISRGGADEESEGDDEASVDAEAEAE